MKDFLGRELYIDDNVILIRPGYRQLLLARIIAFTACNVSVRVKWGNTDWNGFLQEPSALVKVDGPEVTMYLLKSDQSV